MTKPTRPGWGIARRILIILAVLATFIAAFYTEEDWRGKRAWENCKRELEAQGVVLDWNKFMPPDVPDDQNFYTASTNILLRFKMHDANDPDYEAALANPWLRLQITSSNSYPTLNSPIVARIIVTSKAPVNVEQGSNIILVNLDDPSSAERARNLISGVIGPNIQGATGIQFYLFDLKEIRPALIYVLAAIPPSDSAREQLIPSDTQLMLTTAVDQKNFDVQLARHQQMVSAADYLKWSDQYVPAFNDIREALKRPYAIIPGDYSNSAFMPIPNFVTMRALAQTLAQRAQCDLLLGQPDKALQELTLIHNVRRILEKPPTGQPETLVEAMIDVAITGLYVQVIAEGIQRHEWQEPQLEALQGQLAQVNLPPNVGRAFACEIAGPLRTLESLPSWKLRDSLSVHPGTTRISLWQTIKDWSSSPVAYLRASLAPHGWIYQNMVTVSTLMYRQTAGFDSTEGIIQPEKFTNISREFDAIPMRYKFIAAVFIPNVTKAWQTTAYNQTLVNQGQIACALERYRLAHSEYPDTLDALMSQYIESIPQDIIGGRPLHYSRIPDGKFLLYSVGWNEIDDGGQEPPHNLYSVTDYTKGDWVWPGVVK